MPPAQPRRSLLKASTRIIASQLSWLLSNDSVELVVTRLGGHMGPVTFHDGGEPVRPYYLSPWQEELAVPMPAVMRPLRGDFFCLPFGGNPTGWRDEPHPPHGETCGRLWTCCGVESTGSQKTLHLKMSTRARTGVVRRAFTLMDGHGAVYCRTQVEGFEGPTPFAHHANLRLPQTPGALHISCSRFDLGRTYPVPTGDPAKGEYQSLAIDAAFRSLRRVPSIFKEQPATDCSRFPLREGFCDLLQVFERCGKTALRRPSWVAAVNTQERWLWFAFKNPSLMPGRLFWIENHGRHAPPWNGRNACLGIEDGCMYFDRGLEASCRPNPVSRRGFATHVNMGPDKGLDVRYIQGALRVPPGFDEVGKVRFGDNEVSFKSRSGRTASIQIELGFLFASPDE